MRADPATAPTVNGDAGFRGRMRRTIRAYETRCGPSTSCVRGGTTGFEQRLHRLIAAVVYERKSSRCGNQVFAYGVCDLPCSMLASHEIVSITGSSMVVARPSTRRPVFFASQDSLRPTQHDRLNSF